MAVGIDEVLKAFFRSNKKLKFNFQKVAFRGQCYKTFYGRNLRILIISFGVCPRQVFPALFAGKAGVNLWPVL